VRIIKNCCWEDSGGEDGSSEDDICRNSCDANAIDDEALRICTFGECYETPRSLSKTLVILALGRVHKPTLELSKHVCCFLSIIVMD
jgi:hypothetical protein